MSVEPRADSFRVALSDGSSFDIPIEFRRAHALASGLVVQPELLEALRAESAFLAAERRALALLARSVHTRAALGRKLELRGFEPQVVRRVLERLAELGYLDDARAAELWVEQRLERHPEGRAALLHGLLRHGVPRSTAEAAVDAGLPSAQEVEVARRVLLKLYGGGAALDEATERRRALARLLQRGFSRAAARAALQGHAGDDELDDAGGIEG